MGRYTVLDEEAPKPRYEVLPDESAQPQTYGEAFAGGAGSTLRGMTQGALAIPAAGADVLNEAVYRVKQLFDPEAQRSERTLRIVDKLLTRLGVPEGTSPMSERIAGAATGAVSGMGIAGQVGKLGAATPGSVAQTAQTLTKGPISQVVGAGTGAAMAEGAERYGIDSPTALFGIELAGNVLGGVPARSLDKRAGLLDPPTRSQHLLAKELDAEGKLEEGVQATARAKARGIDITPMEATDSSKMRSAGKRAIGEAGDPAVIDAHNLKRAEQSKRAVDEFLDTLAPKRPVEEAGGVGRGLAKEVEDVVVAKRKAAVDPLYAKAFNEAPSPASPEMKRFTGGLLKNPGFQEAWDKVGADMAASAQSNPERAYKNQDMLRLHKMKGLIADEVRKNQAGQPTSLKNVSAFDNVKWKEDIDKVLNAFSPKDPKTGRPYYQDANETFAALTPRVREVREGSVGALGKTEDVGTYRAPEKFFDINKSPLQVSKAFRDLRGRDPEAADTFLRGYLEGALEDASKVANQPEKVAKARIGKTWRDKILKIPDPHRDMLKASMTGKQYKNFTDLEEVLEMTAKAPVAGSEAEYLSAAQKFGDLGTDVIAAGQSALGIKRFIVNVMDRIYTGKHNKEIAKLMFDPDGMAKIAAAKTKDPITQRLIITSVLRGQQNAEKEQE